MWHTDIDISVDQHSRSGNLSLQGHSEFYCNGLQSTIFNTRSQTYTAKTGLVQQLLQTKLIQKIESANLEIIVE